MKTTLLFTLSLIILGATVIAQNVNIPDANFKAFLVGNIDINTNNDSEIQVSEASAFTGKMTCAGQNISDMTGIEAFTSMTKLWCGGNNFNSLDLSSNLALTELYCQQSPSLLSLNISQNVNLENLNLNGNTGLNTIDVSNNTALKYLDIQDNYVSTLNLTQNVNLEILNCGFNYISTLDLSQNTALKNLSCFQNHSLTALDLSNNPNLTNVNCSNNSKLASLNLKNLSPSTLTTLYANTTPDLTCIDVDDVAAATSSWTNIDATASFSLNCSVSAINDGVLSQINVYPNPVSSILTISSSHEIASVTLYDALGEIILVDVSQNQIIDVSNLSSGVYTLNIISNEGSVSKTIVIE